MSVRVAMVEIGIMRMAMGDRAVLVPVAVGFARRILAVVGVLVVRVVAVAMLVPHRRMAMAVLV